MVGWAGLLRVRRRDGSRACAQLSLRSARALALSVCFGVPLSVGYAPAIAAKPAAAVQMSPIALRACQLDGVSQQAQCGSLLRPLNPAQPQGAQIELHFAVLPALARRKKPDAVVALAGGPGQAAISLAGPLSRQWVRALNRRDLLLVDQRGTGRSAPLDCERDDWAGPLDKTDIDHQLARMAACRNKLQALPHGDLRFYTTSIAMADLEAIRQALGWGPVNLVGGSYGTRAALDYQRLYPTAVRRSVLDGVAPPDMVLPASFSADAQASWDALLKACDAQPRCKPAEGSLRSRWDALLAGLPREVQVAHPVTGRDERLLVTRDMVLAWVRQPLYVPALAAGLPHAVQEAAQGRFAALLGLVSGFSGGRQRATQVAMGMHFSVVCAEDAPRLGSAADLPGTDFGDSMKRLYERACADWPRGTVEPAFYKLPVAQSPVLLLSGGADPATPPRHAQRVSSALGAKARHVVVPQAGHGVLALGCMPDAVLRFLDAEDDERALAVDMTCADHVPRPPAFVPVGSGR